MSSARSPSCARVGVTFEDYDLPGEKSPKRGDHGPARRQGCDWFKDSEGTFMAGIRENVS
jgi:hypothetical protein